MQQTFQQQLHVLQQQLAQQQLLLQQQVATTLPAQALVAVGAAAPQTPVMQCTPPAKGSMQTPKQADSAEDKETRGRSRHAHPYARPSTSQRTGKEEQTVYIGDSDEDAFGGMGQITEAISQEQQRALFPAEGSKQPQV